MRRKSSPSKRSVEIQFDNHDAPPQPTSHSSSTTLTGLSPTHTPTLDRPLKSLLRVRLPPTAKNGTLMSIYTPSDSSPSSSLATNSAPRSAARKRVLFVLDEADSQLVRSPGQSSRGHSPSPVSTPTASPPGSNKHRLASHRIENERAPKERRLSGKSGVSPRASRENLRSGKCLTNNDLLVVLVQFFTTHCFSSRATSTPQQRSGVPEDCVLLLSSNVLV